MPDFGYSRASIVTKLGRNAIGIKPNPSQPVLEYFGHFKFFDTRFFIWAWQVSQLLQRLEIAHKDGYSLYLGPGSSFDTKFVRKRPVLTRSHRFSLAYKNVSTYILYSEMPDFGRSIGPIVTKLGRNAIGIKTNPSHPVLEYFGHFIFF